MSETQRDPDDPRGLIREAYRIEGIGSAECRSIFLDWALFHDGAVGPAAARLLARHGVDGHPMDAILAEAGIAPATPKRRGGPGRRRGGGEPE